MHLTPSGHEAGRAVKMKEAPLENGASFVMGLYGAVDFQSPPTFVFNVSASAQAMSRAAAR